MVDRDRTGKKKILAKGSVDMAYHVQEPMESVISVDMKTVSKKITHIKVEICLSSELLREGKATYVIVMCVCVCVHACVCACMCVWCIVLSLYICLSVCLSVCHSEMKT